ncbi:MAG: GIY-YIG nuclease family protein [Solirubrobacterales bacterium]
MIPNPPKTFARPDLEAAGFIGWASWHELLEGGFDGIPNGPACYVVFRVSTEFPEFIDESCGGHFKGKNPTVTTATLTDNWINRANVVYVGKANNARRRIREFALFGTGKPVGHRGGRFIWQLPDSTSLLVAWHPIDWEESARAYERRLLEAFALANSGTRPFANLSG